MCHARELELISNCMKAVNATTVCLGNLHGRCEFSEKIKTQLPAFYLEGVVYIYCFELSGK